VLTKIYFTQLQKMNQAKQKSQKKLKKAGIRNKKTRPQQLRPVRMTNQPSQKKQLR
jgi:hypothetical protein